MDTDDRRRAAVRGSIEGLAYGDAFGERFFGLFRPEAAARELIAARGAPLALTGIAARTPDGPVREGLLRAAGLPPGTGPEGAAAALGSGRRIRADDTVPFALWCAARHPDDLAAALWTAAAGLGDVDTTCAITGGVVGARTGTAALGEEWTRRREQLPHWVAEM